jgi:(2Fe-2S) ferredoxin
MIDHLGVIIKESLATPVDDLPLVGSLTAAEWTLLLVRVPFESLNDHVRSIQDALVPDEPWYAHYWKDDELVVVFSDAIFYATTDDASWGEVVEHGLGRGVPIEELDFEPHTVEDAETAFGVHLR